MSGRDFGYVIQSSAALWNRLSTFSQRGKALDTRLADIKKALGKPYYETSDVLLYHGDSLELLKSMPQQIFDLTVTSPPYNIGKEYEGVLSIEEYISWCETWMSRVHRATSAGGAFWLNVGYVPVPNQGKAVPIPYLLWDKSPFYMIQEVVWNYGAGVASRKSFSPRNEKFLWYVRDPLNYYFDLDSVRDPNVKYPNQKKNGKLKCNPLGKNPTDVWQFPKVTSGAKRSSVERTAHPAQFPSAVIERVIKACSPSDGVILDPFLGSGTTSLTARKQGRCSVGIEIREDYLDIAVGRLEAEAQSLF
uniref:Type II methyltransferase M.ScaI n=1 Tax=Streptomyces caespitosus TaxID=53502 RepID=MTS1_STRCS|nr:RecName: Full=Type II methyltransferase M.ScaI; Short=M.ScaI; AltName: Full=Modification methylase ScaI; AltName: Full=N-4 cytosine-specific methyltransferase ScaI [Streptomyces caespitosus]AAC97178.1 ScaI methyltransferase [Streptomyces caespitosus]